MTVRNTRRARIMRIREQVVVYFQRYIIYHPSISGQLFPFLSQFPSPSLFRLFVWLCLFLDRVREVVQQDFEWRGILHATKQQAHTRARYVLHCGSCWEYLVLYG